MDRYINSVSVDDEIDVSPIISVYNQNFDLVRVIDAYKSFIWTDRYNEVGEFELYFAMSSELLEFIKIGYYLLIDASTHAMVIETLEIKSDLDDGDELIVRGRSLESILDRRVIWGEHTYGGNLHSIIKGFLKDNFITPDIPERKIPKMLFLDNEDPRIFDIDDYHITCDSDNVLDVITQICQEKDIGFRITFDDQFNMVFTLYVGEDRSYNQIKNEYVIFSPDFENIIGTNFLTSKKDYKNVALVLGTDKNGDQLLRTVGNTSGLERREIMSDARDISQENNPDYEKQITARGTETLSDKKVTTAYEGSIEALHTFVYGKDFFIGDIVQIEDSYGNVGTVYVSEIVISFDEGGYSIYPTFKSTEETEV